MNLYILDTDHVTLLRRGNAHITARVSKFASDEIATTIVTVEEQISGWYARIRQARDLDDLELAYSGLSDVVEWAKTIHVLPFTRSALECYTALRQKFRRHGKMDLAIAAIVIEHGGRLVTRNRTDFENIPGLVIEDWSVPITEG